MFILVLFNYSFAQEEETAGPDGFRLAESADSLLNGELAPQNLDSLYAMQDAKPKLETGSGWWTAPRVMRVVAFTLSAACLGVSVWQNKEVELKNENAEINLKNAETVLKSSSPDWDNYGRLQKKYNGSKSELWDAENMRNGFAVGAGAFGLIGLVTFFF
ncbi:MAG: hypothetical protein LBB36_05390 [Fibromonadaceae bacterium]|nr:hypothetical protein [Fibromonadaceae bacterium]